MCCCSRLSNGCSKLEIASVAAELGAAAEAEGEHDSLREFCDQGNVSGSGRFVLPGHRAVAGEILPAVAVADIAGAGSPDRIALSFIDRRQRDAKRPLLGPQGPAPAMQDDGGAVTIAGGPEMGSQERVDPELRIAVETALDRQHIAPSVRGNAQAQRIALVPMDDFDGRNAGRQEPQPIVGDALHLGPEAVAVGNDEAEVADLRDVDARVVHFVDDAEPQGEPEARKPQRTSHHVLGAARPSRCGPWTSRRACDHRSPSCFFCARAADLWIVPARTNWARTADQ